MRERERVADEDALRLLVKAGYDPSGMFEFFSRLRYEKPELSRAFSAEDLLAERSQWELSGTPADSVLDTSQFSEMHARLAQLK